MKSYHQRSILHQLQVLSSPMIEFMMIGREETLSRTTVESSAWFQVVDDEVCQGDSSPHSRLQIQVVQTNLLYWGAVPHSRSNLHQYLWQQTTLPRLNLALESWIVDPPHHCVNHQQWHHQHHQHHAFQLHLISLALVTLRYQHSSMTHKSNHNFSWSWFMICIITIIFVENCSLLDHDHISSWISLVAGDVRSQDIIITSLDSGQCQVVVTSAAVVHTESLTVAGHSADTPVLWYSSAQSVAPG